MTESIDPELITRTTSSDSNAVGNLYERYRVNIYRYLYYRVGNTQVAEDLTSEVFIRMIRAIREYRAQNTSMEAWLYQIARNLAIDHHRKMSVRNHVILEEDLIAESEDVDKTVEQNLTSDILVRALAKLSEEQRDVIVLRFVNCLPVAQVAQALHKSEDAIKGLQRRGLMALREILTEWEVHYV